MKKAVRLIFLLLLPALTNAQSMLPECPGNFGIFWSKCFGTVHRANGDKYAGEFLYGMPHGRGIEYDANGSVRRQGEWNNGRLVSNFAVQQLQISLNSDAELLRLRAEVEEAKKKHAEAEEQLRLAQPQASSMQMGPSSNRIRMVESGGTYSIPVRLNDQITLDFTLDSGAADVTVPADVVLTLMRTKTITNADFKGEQRYSLADGTVVKSKTFVLRNVKVGDKTVTNVMASIGDVKGSLLLGQSFLKKLRYWAIDNVTKEMVMN